MTIRRTHFGVVTENGVEISHLPLCTLTRLSYASQYTVQFLTMYCVRARVVVVNVATPVQD
jgi:hypothetical protein